MFTYAKIVAGTIKLLNGIVAALQQHHTEIMATLVQKGATDAATIKELEAVSAPTTITERDKLWTDNQQKFGADGGPSQK